MKKPKSGGKKGAPPAPKVTERYGWRPGDKFDPTEEFGIMKVADLASAAAKDNPREWSSRALSILAHSIERLGILNYPIFNRRTKRLVAGHMRVQALLKKLKWAQCPVRFVNTDAETEELARVQDNNRAGQGRWTEDVQAHLKEIEKRDREAFVQLGLENILEQLANQSGSPEESEGSDRERTEGDGEGYVNITYRLPAGAAMAIKAKIDETIAKRGLVGKTAKGQALEILVANGDPEHACITQAQLEKAVDEALEKERKRLGLDPEPR